MIALIVILGVAFLLFILVANIKGQQQNEETNKIISQKFGDGEKPTCDIDGSSALLECILGHYNIKVFEKSETIVINCFPFKFEQIVDFQLNDTASYKTSTSTLGAIGRAAVGGAIFGGVGAIIGASTAKKTTVKNDEYKFLITTNDFKNPCQKFATPHEHVADQVYSILKIIVDRNMQKDK